MDIYADNKLAKGRIMKKNVLYLWVSGILLGASIFMGCADNTNSQDKLSQTLVNVEVASACNPTEGQIFTYSGAIEESETTPLSFQVVGNVKQVLVKEGDYVKTGQVLAILNNENYKSSYEMSFASLKQAEDAYKRLLPMYKNGNLPEIKLIEVETSLQQAKSATAIAKKNIDDCVLKSTTSGVVGKRSIEPGMTALPGIAAINIVKIEKVYAKIPIPENEIANLHKGQKAVVKVSAIGGGEITGIVEEIGVLADPLAHSYKVKIAIVNSGRKLMPGMICNAMIKSDKQLNGLIVPNKAVQIDDNNRNFVYAVEANKAVKKYVVTGALVRDGISIKEGLVGSEKIIVAGQNRITENSIVNIVNK